MDEARRVLERLDRIDGLRRAAAGPAAIVEELRALVREGESWLAAERAEGTERAGATLDRLEQAVVAADRRSRGGG